MMYLLIILVLVFLGLWLLGSKVLDHYDRKACRKGAKRLMASEAKSLFKSEEDCYEFLLRTLKKASPPFWGKAR